MKAEELRIGNAVKPIHPQYNEKYIETESITYNAINVYFREYSIDEIEPIPLTEEWLKKFGFQITYKQYLQPPNWLNALRTFRIKFNTHYCIVKGLNGTEYKYVHELQNLHFVLTGNEIEL
jgi:hypothetical protein